MNDELANDRTYLAWLRTGIALFGLGFVVAKVAFIVQQGTTAVDQDLYSAVGVVIVLCGAALITVGYLQHTTVAKSLQRDAATPRPRPGWPLTITAVAVAGSLLLSVLIIVST